MNVLQSESPRQVQVLVKAVLNNTCAQLGEATINRQGYAFNIDLPATNRAGSDCQAASVNQDQVIQLPEDGLTPGNYIVLVNGVLGIFQVAAPAQPTVVAGVAATPTAVPTATLVPTATPTAVVTETPAQPAPGPAAKPTVGPLILPSPTATQLPLPVGADSGSCTNKAAYYGYLTVPEGKPFQPGAKFTKTWLVLNAGSCTWGEGYNLVFIGGDPLGAPQKVPLPKASPRQVVQVSVDMTAPIPPQSYISNWAFESPEGYIFGMGNPAIIPLTAKINVVQLPADLPTGLDCGALRLRDQEQQVLEEINKVRAYYGLYPLELQEDISTVAYKYSLELACYNRESHYGLDGVKYNVRLQRDSVLFQTSNEIIYTGNGGPAGAVKWWLASHIHRPIVLTSKYTKIGIGFVYYDKWKFQQRIVVDFIVP